MPRKRQLHERIKDRMDGKDPDAATKQATAEEKAKKFSGSPEEVVRALNPKQREALFDELDQLRFDDFKYPEESENEDE